MGKQSAIGQQGQLCCTGCAEKSYKQYVEQRIHFVLN